jgi:hypothetical protein
MLSLLATGDYRGAAIEAHTLAAMNAVPDWATLYGFYGRLEPFVQQLRIMEKQARDNQNSPEVHALLGFIYLMEGYRWEAQDMFVRTLQLAPNDRIAAELLTQAGGAVPMGIERQLPQPAKKSAVQAASRRSPQQK